MKKQVMYLGSQMGDGLHLVQEKIDAIKNAPPLEDVSELPSFLVPLHQLLKKDVQWRWAGVEQRAYEKCREGLSSDALLVH